jgi:hypothetical protein
MKKKQQGYHLLKKPQKEPNKGRQKQTKNKKDTLVSFSYSHTYSWTINNSRYDSECIYFIKSLQWVLVFGSKHRKIKICLWLDLDTESSYVCNF